MMVPACSSGTLTNVQPHRNAMLQDTGHDTPPRHSIQTRGRPIAVLSIDFRKGYCDFQYFAQHLRTAE